jgi:2-polyprenyl-6-methoxyphenol hydroxylase-like FAD-dependent oxidoreductase
LTAARVLSDHFERVTILERDRLTEGPDARPGVPQGKQVHGLLAGGQRALNRLFPGFTDDLERVGAIRLQAGLDLIIERPGYDPFPQRDLGFFSSGVTRPQLEYCLRRRVEAIANVHLEPGCRVLGLLATDDGAAVHGVQCQRDRRTETRSADLVVDASGSGELTVAALRAMGHPGVAETTIGVDIAYSSATFDIPGSAPTNWKGVMHIPSAPKTSRGGLLYPIEGDRWMLGLGGRHGEHPPSDEAGLRDYAASLRTKTIAEAIASARMLSRVDRFLFAESRLRHFERLETFPRGLLPIGDAICRFNPVFGQGISVAAIEGEALGETLSSVAQGGGALASVWRPFFQRMAEIIEAPWVMAAVPDFIFPHTVGERPANFDASVRFTIALTRATARHPDIHRLAAEIQHLLQPRRALMEPHVLERIMGEMNS